MNTIVATSNENRGSAAPQMAPEEGMQAHRVEKGAVTFLAELPPDSHIDGVSLARMLGCCKKSVQRAVRRGELPPPFKFMGRHVWLVRAILEHLQSSQRAACQQLERRAVRLERQRTP